MLLTAIALFLSIAGIAAFPCWRHSARWGYAPSTAAGILLFFVSLLILGGKVVTSEASAHRLASQPQRQTSVDVSLIEKASARRTLAQSVFLNPRPIPMRHNVVEIAANQ
jgi:hypothetical protein